MIIYAENRVHTRNLLRTKYAQEKGYINLLVLLSILFVQFFIHTKKCGCITHVCVQYVIYGGMFKDTQKAT